MLKLAIFGSGSGTNCQAIIDAIEAGTLHAQITCVLSDVEDAYILERARKHNIPAIHFDCAPFKTKLDGGKKAFDYGVKFTGCTVHFVDAGVDTGAVINQKIIAVEDGDSFESMMEKLHAQEHIAYPEALQWIAESRINFAGRRITLT